MVVNKMKSMDKGILNAESNLIGVITAPISTPALDKICYAFVVVDYSTQGESPWVRPVCEGDARLRARHVHWSNNVE